MMTEQHTKLHIKCINILDLMNRAQARVIDAEWYLQKYDKADPYSPISLFNTREKLLREIRFKREVHARLISYYADNLIKLIQPAANKAFFHILNN